MNLHLPVYSDNAALWFAQLDVYFVAHNIMPVQQLHVLYNGLPPTLACFVNDLITDLLSEATYFSIKAKILRWNTQSVESRFCILIKNI